MKVLPLILLVSCMGSFEPLTVPSEASQPTAEEKLRQEAKLKDRTVSRQKNDIRKLNTELTAAQAQLKELCGKARNLSWDDKTGRCNEKKIKKGFISKKLEVLKALGEK